MQVIVCFVGVFFAQFSYFAGYFCSYPHFTLQSKHRNKDICGTNYGLSVAFYKRFSITMLQKNFGAEGVLFRRNILAPSKKYNV